MAMTTQEKLIQTQKIVADLKQRHETLKLKAAVASSRIEEAKKQAIEQVQTDNVEEIRNKVRSINKENEELVENFRIQAQKAKELIEELESVAKTANL